MLAQDEKTSVPSAHMKFGKTQERPTPYEKFDSAKLILRDELALDRTILANERTMLAYARTVLGLALAAGTLFKLFPGSTDMMIIGGICALAALVFGVVGMMRFVRVHKELTALRVKKGIITSNETVLATEEVF
jgi:putative membrane protein